MKFLLTRLLLDQSSTVEKSGAALLKSFITLEPGFQSKNFQQDRFFVLTGNGGVCYVVLRGLCSEVFAYCFSKHEIIASRFVIDEVIRSLEEFKEIVILTVREFWEKSRRSEEEGGLQ